MVEEYFGRTSVSVALEMICQESSEGGLEGWNRKG